MSKKKNKETSVEKFDLNHSDFPVSVIVSTTQLPALIDYVYEECGVSFEGEVELRHLTVTGLKDEEPKDEEYND